MGAGVVAGTLAGARRRVSLLGSPTANGTYYFYMDCGSLAGSRSSCVRVIQVGSACLETSLQRAVQPMSLRSELEVPVSGVSAHGRAAFKLNPSFHWHHNESHPGTGTGRYRHWQS
jgi:hypothetical protein